MINRASTVTVVFILIYQVSNTTAVDCSVNPCENGGTCRDDGVDYNCTCVAGFFDKNCTTTTDSNSPTTTTEISTTTTDSLTTTSPTEVEATTTEILRITSTTEVPTTTEAPTKTDTPTATSIESLTTRTEVKATSTTEAAMTILTTDELTSTLTSEAPTTTSTTNPPTAKAVSSITSTREAPATTSTTETSTTLCTTEASSTTSTQVSAITLPTEAPTTTSIIEDPPTTTEVPTTTPTPHAQTATSTTDEPTPTSTSESTTEAPTTTSTQAPTTTSTTKASTTTTTEGLSTTSTTQSPITTTTSITDTKTTTSTTGETTATSSTVAFTTTSTREATTTTETPTTSSALITEKTVHNLYPFGILAGGQAMAKNDDGNSGVIPISTAFPFFNKQHTSLIVSTNGAVSFLNPVSAYTPIAFPLLGDRRVLFPFWGDVDTRKGGTVWYRETTNGAILASATEEIRTYFPEFYRFNASWIFISTWDQVAAYGCVQCSNTNTFQAMLITDGQYSFTIFNYNEITWIYGTASNGIPAQVGFQAGDVFYAVNGSRTSDIININKMSNVGKPGKFAFRIDSSQIGCDGCTNDDSTELTTEAPTTISTTDEPNSALETDESLVIDETTLRAAELSTARTENQTTTTEAPNISSTTVAPTTTSESPTTTTKVPTTTSTTETLTMTSMKQAPTTTTDFPITTVTDSIASTTKAPVTITTTDVPNSTLITDEMSATPTDATTIIKTIEVSTTTIDDQTTTAETATIKTTEATTTTTEVPTTVSTTETLTMTSTTEAPTTVTEVQVTTETEITIPDLYPFGVAAGDQAMAKNDDGNSGVIPISTSFPFFNKQHTSLIVSTNGAVSFLNPISSYRPSEFPLDGDRQVLFPFWGDVDTRKGGTVWYRETTNGAILASATEEIRTYFPEYYRFNASWVFISTWDQVAAYGCVQCSNRNTFQALLITDGQYSFTVFNYNEITWTYGTASNGIPAQVGFQAGDVFYAVNGSRTSNIINVNKMSNVGKPGKFAFRIDSSQIGCFGCTNDDSTTLTTESPTTISTTDEPTSSLETDELSTIDETTLRAREISTTRIENQTTTAKDPTITSTTEAPTTMSESPTTTTKDPTTTSTAETLTMTSTTEAPTTTTDIPITTVTEVSTTTTEDQTITSEVPTIKTTTEAPTITTEVPTTASTTETLLMTPTTETPTTATEVPVTTGTETPATSTMEPSTMTATTETQTGTSTIGVSTATTTTEISIHDLYPFGMAAGDQAMAKNDDGNSGVIPISTSFPFFNKQHTSLIVSTNGAVSFLNPISSYRPSAFPLDGDRQVLFPFWADVNTLVGGTVWYRETTNSAILARATEEIRTYFLEFYRFNASWVFISTWDQVAAYGCGQCSNRNTFQAILITDGQYSFTIFNYNEITWTYGTASGGTPAQVGFQAGDLFHAVDGSRTSDIINITKMSNVGKPGKFSFRIDSSQIGCVNCTNDTTDSTTWTTEITTTSTTDASTTTEITTTTTELPTTSSTTEVEATTAEDLSITSTEVPTTTTESPTKTNAPITTTTDVPTTMTEAPTTTKTQNTTSTTVPTTTREDQAKLITEVPTTTSEIEGSTTTLEIPSTTLITESLSTTTEAPATSFIEAPTTTSTTDVPTPTSPSYVPTTTSTTEDPLTTTEDPSTISTTEASITTSTTEAPTTLTTKAPTTTLTYIPTATTATEAPTKTSTTEDPSTTTEVPFTTSTTQPQTTTSTTTDEPTPTPTSEALTTTSTTEDPPTTKEVWSTISTVEALVTISTTEAPTEIPTTLSTREGPTTTSTQAPSMTPTTTALTTTSTIVDPTITTEVPSTSLTTESLVKKSTTDDPTTSTTEASIITSTTEAPTSSQTPTIAPTTEATATTSTIETETTTDVRTQTIEVPSTFTTEIPNTTQTTVEPIETSTLEAPSITSTTENPPTTTEVPFITSTTEGSVTKSRTEAPTTSRTEAPTTSRTEGPTTLSTTKSATTTSTQTRTAEATTTILTTERSITTDVQTTTIEAPSTFTTEPLTTSSTTFETISTSDAMTITSTTEDPLTTTEVLSSSSTTETPVTTSTTEYPTTTLIQAPATTSTTEAPTTTSTTEARITTTTEAPTTTTTEALSKQSTTQTLTTTTTTTEAPTTTSTTKATTMTSTTEIPTTTSAPITAFTYGSSEGDYQVSGDDVMGNPIRGQIQTFVGDGSSGSFDTVYVGTNGLMGLGDRYNSYVAQDLTSWNTRSRRIICPYWTDLISGGNVYYHGYSRGNSFDQLTIDRANDVIRAYYNTDFPDFQASWVVKATWENMKFFADSSRSQEVTFQAVLVSDGENTFVLVYYIDVNIAQPISNLRVSMGYRFRAFYRSNQYSNQLASFRMSVIPGNTGHNGFWIYKMTTVVDYSPQERQCLNWYISNKLQHVHDQLLFRRNFWTYLCPCRSEWLWFDGFWMVSRIDVPNNVLCYARLFGIFGGSAECCYPMLSFWGLGSRTWRIPASGTLLQYNPFFEPQQWYLNDVESKEVCCGSGHCDWYYEVRPRTRCYTTLWWGFAFLFGDPHIVTLDGNQYTFNGWGEYTMIQIRSGNTSFDLQARTTLATNENGTTINATIFSAFAARDQTGAHFQVELSRNLNKIYVRGNGRDITSEFDRDPTFTLLSPGIQISKENNTFIGTFMQSSITVKVTTGVRFLTVDVSVDNQYRGNISGLMGNFDTDPTNDFLLPNGTTLTANETDTERKIYLNFGQIWSVNETSSIFQYRDGLSHTDYVHPDFVPFFIDEFSQEKRDVARETCGGDKATQGCIFDYLATGDTSLALSSGSTEDAVATETADLNNDTPEIEGEAQVTVKVNETVQMKFNASDDGTFRYEVINKPESGFSFNNATGVATWTPSSANVTSISVSATDNQGASASPWDVAIIMCNGCSNHGTCDYNVTRPSTNDMFKLATCDCHTGYTGDDCEEDENACEESPCPLGRNCTDLTPIDQLRFGRGYNCSTCPPGFDDIDSKCEDINECNSTITNVCDQVCQNTEGSYNCNCFNGYRKIAGVCQDIDECNEGTSGCEQSCDNTAGSFMCSCVYGFELKEDNKTCNQTLDVCQLNKLTCEYACMNKTGTYECICPAGYELESNNQNCSNIDECQRRICSQECTDTIGSFKCSCYTGYQLNTDGATCSACVPPSYGTNCNQTCSCGPGTDRCDSVRGCICSSGWSGAHCNQDVDECTENPTICGIDKICKNLIGGYSCNCLSGYKKVSGKCVDIDECGNAGLNNCTAATSTCSNNNGSYTCTCKPGYVQNNAYQCQDFDECAASVDGCSQICNNVDGGFNCDCEFGYSLDDDRKTCSRVRDICSLYPNLNCSFGCKQNPQNIITGYCFCPSGYALNAQDQRSCIDINECLNDTLNLCSDKTTCVNTPGSYNCTCKTGFFLANDGRTCTACDGFSYGVNCQTPCNCGRGSARCDNVKGCVCNTGWVGDKCNADIDECAAGTPCTGAHQVCQNTLGSYNCICQTGFTKVGSNCEDINECANSPCSQECNNTIGSYVCSCSAGFRLIEKTQCQDIDECSAPVNPCDQTCMNTMGSYQCSCLDGFILNTTTRTNCHIKSACSNTTFDCSQNCGVRTGGSEYCFCNNGYSLDPEDNVTCNDIDECSQNPCSDTCNQNEPGQGYSCSCSPGKKLDIDQRTCITCSPGRYGANCGGTCVCVTANTQSCDVVYGVCTCKLGWSGTNCDIDIDECSNNTICPDNSECHNKNGSYSCVCNSGFSLADGVCVGCSSTTFGQNCAQQCTCNFVNTRVCDKENGSCTCNSGWQGNNCADDVPECDTPNICGKNSICTEQAGTYSCSCEAGYEKDTTGTCINTDECVRGADDCHANAVCTDTDGSFNCSCISGFWGDGVTCTDIDDCASDPCENNGTCADLLKDYRCECVDGFTDKNCSTNIDDCAGDPCENNGTCADLLKDYRCECVDGFTDKNCSTNIDDCAGVPCENNGTCADLLSGYRCECVDGFTDKNCSTNIDECAGDPCQNIGTCTDLVNNYSCECVDGFTDKNCSTNINECARDPCENNGTCIDLLNDYICKCVDGFTNTNCSTNINECAGYPCRNNGTCTDLVNNYSCECIDGFTDTNCSTNIDECAGNPCQNNGTCMDLVNDYICECVDGFTDKNCSIGQKEGKTNVEISLNINISASDLISRYSEIERDITVSLTLVYTTITGFIKVVILNITTGSLIVNHEIVYDASTSVQSNGDIGKIIYNLATGKVNVIFNGSIVSVTSVKLKDREFSSTDTLCTVFTSLSPCPQDQSCIEIGGVVQCKYIEKDDNFDLIVGLSVGLPLLFLLVLVSAIICIHNKRRMQQEFPSAFDDYKRTMHGDFFGDGIPTHLDSSRRRNPYILQKWDDESTMSGYSHRRDGSNIMYPVQDSYNFDNAAKSSFSKDFMNQASDPKLQYQQIKRSQTDIQPNPIYT